MPLHTRYAVPVRENYLIAVIISTLEFARSLVDNDNDDAILREVRRNGVVRSEDGQRLW